MTDKYGEPLDWRVGAACYYRAGKVGGEVGMVGYLFSALDLSFERVN